MSNLPDGDVNTASASTLPAIERIFGIDLRSLAFFRMALGVTVIADLLLRWRFLGAHYADPGVLPRAAGIPGIPGLSMHGLSGSIAFEGLLFTLAVGFAFLFLIGLHTRVATVASWLLMTSLHLRNPILLDGGDAMARWLLLWSIFLPLGACWSVDSRNPGRRFPPSNGGRVFSLATVAILLQLVLLYWGGGLCKTGPEWTSDGTALERILQNEYWSRPMARHLLEFPGLLRLLTPAVLLFELLAPLLLFVPVFTAPLRVATIAALALFQLGLALTIELNLFPFFSTVAALVFVPSCLWEKLGCPMPERALRSPLGERGLRSRGRDALVLSLLGFVVAQNLANLGFLPAAQQLGAVGEPLLITQRWQMYARAPVEDVSFELQGKSAERPWHDLLDPAGGEGRKFVRSFHESYRSKYYVERLLVDPRYERLQRPYLEWLCRQCNAAKTSGEAFASVRFVRITREIRPVPQPRAPELRSPLPAVVCDDP